MRRDHRDADEPRSWAEIYRELAERHDDLTPSELERLAISAYLMGDDHRCAEAWEEAYRRHIEASDRAEAARCSFWLAFCLMMRGQMAHAGAWLGRTHEAVEDADPRAARGPACG